MELDSTHTGREPDALWIKQIVGGNREAFEKLYGEYQKRLFRYFMRLVSVTEAAEELTNDVLVEVCKKAGDFRGLSKVSTWIFGIAHHKAMNELRGRKPPTVDIEAAANESDRGATHEENAAQVNLKERVKRALQALSSEHREVMELHFHQRIIVPGDNRWASIGGEHFTKTPVGQATSGSRRSCGSDFTRTHGAALRASS